MIFDRLFSALSPQRDSKPDQNIIGFYVCMSIWTVSLVFCVFYLMIQVDPVKILFLGILAVLGVFSSILFRRNKNFQAVLIQCALMIASLCIVLTFPVIGKHANLCFLIIAISPLVFLKELHYGLIALNFFLCIVLLSCSELLPRSQGSALTEIYEYFIKLMVFIFVFCQTFALRLMMEKRH